MKHKKRLYPLLSLILLLPFLFYHGNNAIDITTYTIDQDDLSGLRIIHLSDLHNKTFGKNQEKLVEKINSYKPDLIVFTGDQIDSRRKGHENALTLMQELSKTYPIYSINGNHDYCEDGYELKMEMNSLGVVTLENAYDIYYYNDIPVQIKGVEDPIFYNRSSRDEEFKSSIEILDDSVYNILLSHRPERFNDYVDANYNLVLTGHAHGGQLRLPFIGGLIAPHQGMLPKYDGNEHQSDKTTMIVSRGLGNSLFPFRIFNNPEIVVIDFN